MLFLSLVRVGECRLCEFVAFFKHLCEISPNPSSVEVLGRPPRRRGVQQADDAHSASANLSPLRTYPP